MRVYFLSCTPAILKLNGLYVGYIDNFERHIELDPADKVLAEIVPGENLQGVNFFLDEKFFADPPEFADVYLLENDALVFIREYDRKDVKLSVIYQTRFCGNLITVFSQGGVYLSCEGAEYTLTPLPVQFMKCRAEEEKLAGRDVLALYGGNKLIVISDGGKVIFKNTVETAEFGDGLLVRAPFETCTAAKAECSYSYDGEKLTQTGGRTIETRQPEPNIAHFAFFESVLTCGDFEKYLDDSLKPKAGDLKSYLGNFVSVTVPTEKFYTLHRNLTAAGLVYPKKKNLYEVKYFAVEMNGGKITNLYPVEN
ncbi:MAG: hypothetical protein K2N22_01480 [Clostridia bacterium]|nr:hypothetical protein [Clostridia bacterium]